MTKGSFPHLKTVSEGKKRKKKKEMAGGEVADALQEGIANQGGRNHRKRRRIMGG